LSPLYGGIFASLLFILFAAGLLQGSAFPKIETATGLQVLETATDKPTATASPTPDRRTDTQRTGILHVKDFLKETGPSDGVSFPFLMIWSFIAGLAERLVPDTLNRLVAKNEALQGTNT